ncbi:hypothetical protein K1T71_014617 [Dendrolimus kikuchii]|uniref:Uncharacterized protein n=1 Tax=Dendrolimus kikuchii TaxID=765133 RepID=A0ACC1CEK8_9NEOP|nr:hypothetical protein K1T71_014617 [Dendrolimus kikuchii]
MAYTNKFKFESHQNMKLVKLYRSYECLWNTSDENYKNRHSRSKAMEDLVQNLNIPGFGVKDLTMKIKNIRSQYLQEKKKIRELLENGEVYESKLPWYAFMDSFLANNYGNTSTTYSATDEILDNYDVYEDEIENKIEECDPMFVDSKDNVIMTLKKNQTNKRIKKKNKKHGGDDELAAFGNYVVANLRILNQKSCIHAQDDIQAVLSKYKLKNLRDSQASSIRQSFDSEEQSSATEESE